ncbi:hypothetical protein F5Y10DRAFT_267104 [Nemania abortiva]|nr:hypothetical protein F5Y10DRAFT_267104 [Nemania abortiva]
MPRQISVAPSECPILPEVYHEIPKESIDLDSLESLADPQPANPNRFWRLVALIAILAFALIAFVAVAHRRPTQKHHGHYDESVVSCDCGTSVAEARSMGCKYDTLAASWLPDACRDDELSAQFDQAGPNGTSWAYFADSKATMELSVEEVSRLPDSELNCFWVPQRWHLLHCTFYWKKLHRQRKTGVVLERHYNRIGHIEHCEMLLLSSEDLDGIVTEAAVGLSGDRLELGPSGGCPPDQGANR